MSSFTKSSIRGCGASVLRTLETSVGIAELRRVRCASWLVSHGPNCAYCRDSGETRRRAIEATSVALRGLRDKVHIDQWQKGVSNLVDHWQYDTVDGIEEMVFFIDTRSVEDRC